MSTGFEALLKVLIGSGIRLSPEDAADALWLSTRLFESIEVNSKQPINTQSEPVPLPEVGDISNVFEKPVEKRRKREDFDEIKMREKVALETTLHGLGESAKGRMIRGHPIRLPSAPTLPQMLEIERALRPLARRKPSKYRHELDETATADFIATSNIWNIIQRPADERWLEGVLVIEQSPTMRLWQETVKEFRQLLWRVGAFRWLETIHLDAFNAEPRLTSPINTSQIRHPISICRPDSTRVIFLCTDSLSNAWLSGKIPEWLTLWSKHHSVVVLQMLPEHMWRRTSLRRATFVMGSANAPISAPIVRNPEFNFDGSVPSIPIVSLQPESLRNLSDFLTASPSNQISCYWNQPIKFKETTKRDLQTPDQNFRPDEEFAIKSFERFKETVSPLTLDIARYLSIVPLFLPIMRLVQYTFVPNAQPAHLAELFNSGILYRISPPYLGEHPNQIEYDFLPGIREILLNQRSRPLISNVWTVLSKYIDDRFGRGKEFLSIIYDPTSVEEFVSGIKNESQLPFARIGAMVLKRMGEIKSAEQLETIINGFEYFNDQENTDAFDNANSSISSKPAAESSTNKISRPSKSTTRSARQSYLEIEEKIKISLQSGATYLSLADMGLSELPESIGQLIQLRSLDLQGNYLSQLPESLNQLTNLQELDISYNRLNNLSASIGKSINLLSLNVSNNSLMDLPVSLVDLLNLKSLNLDNNPLNPELAEAYNQGVEGVYAYLRSKSESLVVLDEAKLILVGEGEVGKTALIDALLGSSWMEHPTTHGIEIKRLQISDPLSKKLITLNVWDFGGQRVYRPLYQLFFSAPAVYLIVWKPREGSQAGQVKEWIQLVKRREPSAKILVVATHGGPRQRQPDIDRQELWDLFGRETVVDFFFVDSKPDAHGQRKGIDELKRAIAQVAASLPEVGRSMPKSFADVRQALQATGKAYLPLRDVLDICRAHNMDGEIARLFITISHRLGHLTHYENDPTLRDIVILRPDWLATAMNYILDDEATRAAHGLVKFSRLAQLWDDKNRAADSRYPATLHPIFLRLMERFDLSYRVADPTSRSNSDPISLIGQLVPDNRPQNISDVWKSSPASGDIQQTQICHIVDASNGQSASAEGLFYQLIVRLHKYSLGRADYNASVHWQRGLVLEDEFKSRAFLEHVGNDVRITVRSPYPEGLLGMLTREVKFLVESFWEGLRCDVMVPCIEPCGKNMPGTGMFEVEKLLAYKRQGVKMFPCMVSGCNQAQDIDALLRNAPTATQQISLADLQSEFASLKSDLRDDMNTNTRRILSQVDKTYTDLLQVLTDEAKEGPRLFSLFPLDGSKFNPKTWIRHQFRLVLWCEHSRLPLPVLNNGDMKKGVYDFELDKEWFKKTAPYLKLVASTLSLVLPVASSMLKIGSNAATAAIQEQIGLGKDFIDALPGEMAALNEFSGVIDSTNLERGVGSSAKNATLRELHALLKAKDPGYGGLVRVMNKRQEFLWVHEKFAGEY